MEIDTNLWSLDEIKNNTFYFIIGSVKRIKGDRFDIKEKEFNKAKFERLLIKTHLEDYTEQLWKMGINFAIRKDIVNTPKQPNKQRKKIKLGKQIELIKSLLFFVTNESVKIKILSCTYKDSILVENELICDKIICDCKKTLIEKIRYYKLDRIPMSYRRGKLLLEGKDNSKRNKFRQKHLEKWKREYILEYVRNIGLSESEVYNSNYYVDSEMINCYIANEYHLATLNKMFLEKKLKELENTKPAKKQGAPPKNEYIAGDLIKIATLIKAKKILLENKKPLESIKIANKDFTLIYDYFDFFGLIPKEVTTSGSYIKSIYSYYTKKLPNLRCSSKLNDLIYLLRND